MAGKTLTRADISEAVHRQVGLSRTESAHLVNAIIDTIAEAAVGGARVKLSSFGTFTVRQKGARIGRNPRTRVEVPITPRRVLVFRPSAVIKDRVNGTKGDGEDGMSWKVR